MKKFDLLRELPELDTKTLNYVWDTLWRFNACSRRKNSDERTRCSERERIMKLLEEVAN